MASSQGSATDAPMPRSRVRREIGRMLMLSSPSLILYALAPPQAEGIALYDFDHQRGEPVLVLGQGGQGAVDRAVIVVFEAAAQPVDRHLLDHAAREAVLLRE